MGTVDSLQPDGRVTGGVQRCNVTKLLTDVRSFFIQGFDLAVVLGQTIEEFIDRAILQSLRYQAANREIVRLEVNPEFACEDGELACYVHARQVITWVRLGVPILPGIADDFRKWP